MKFDVYDPAIHGENDWAEINAANAHEAAVKYMTAYDPGDFDPEGVYPILVRASYDDWEALAIGIGLLGGLFMAATTSTLTGLGLRLILPLSILHRR